MDTTTRYVVVWVSGVTTGLVMGERWRRAAAHADPAGDDGGDPLAATVSTTPAAASETPKVSAWVIAGVKSDARRVRRALDRLTPWGTTEASIGQLNRAQAEHDRQRTS